MLKLRKKVQGYELLDLTSRQIFRVTNDLEYPRAIRTKAALITSSEDADTSGFGLILWQGNQAPDNAKDEITVELPNDLDYLREGDVIRLDTNFRISVLFRKNSLNNTLFVTERCNHFCIMCSQPPRNIQDDYLIEDLIDAVPLMCEVNELVISGGEPTLLWGNLIRLVKRLKSYLPATAVHVLSNGRKFSDMRSAIELAEVDHPDLMIGIPLYSAVPDVHDFVVQASGAFDDTVRGILNLKRARVPVEIRMVIHSQTSGGLVEYARFLSRNLQFVDQVALMGLEVTGFAMANVDELWCEPEEYMLDLIAAVKILEAVGMRVKIYNHQLCVLDRSLWPFAVKSISDWKNDYLSECKNCSQRGQCGGVFATSHGRYPQGIHTI